MDKIANIFFFEVDFTITYYFFKAQQHIHQYQFMRWPDHGTPLTTSSFFRLHKAAMESQNLGRSTSPIIVHCSAGAGRTGTFIGYDLLLEECREKNRIDIFGCILNMRRQRMDMVQNCDQYEFLHKLMLESVLFGDTDVGIAELANKRKEDSRMTDVSTIENEFESLSAAEMMKSSNKKNSCKVIITTQPGESRSISINATHVESHNENTSLIAAQAPSAATLEDFWRAVFDNEVQTIVMLNRNNGTKSVQYWPLQEGEVIDLKSMAINLVDEHVLGDITERKLTVMRGTNRKTITQYQLAGWTGQAVPENPVSVLELASKLRSDKKTVTLVHCSDGLGRTGAFCTILNLIERLKTENRVDVFRTVKDLRDCRPGMVQTLDQYRFCYDAVLAHLSSVNVYANEIVAAPGSVYENVIVP